jgi:hypothetical protein
MEERYFLITKYKNGLISFYDITTLHDLKFVLFHTQGFFMWLNKGSKLQMFWNVEGGNRRYHDMLVLLIKGTSYCGSFYWLIFL